MLRYVMKLIPALIFILLLLPLCASCTSFDLVTCTVIGSDCSPQGSTDIFYMDSPQVCCSARLGGTGDNATVKARWIKVQGNGAASDKLLTGEQKADCVKNGNFGFTLKPPAMGFNPGEYKVALMVGDREIAHKKFTIVKDSSVNLPIIGVFSADNLSIHAEQQATLKWNVIGATRIVIEPSPGAVDASGSATVSPMTDTAYTIYAVNRGGTSYSSLAIKVIQPVTVKPDLLITELWSSGNVLSYRVRNTGAAPSCPSQSYLYKNDVKEAEDHLAPLNPGEERVEQFANYHFSPRFASMGVNAQEVASDAVNIRICANADRACVETNSSNNCFDYNFGPLFNLNLLRFAGTAAWRSSSGELKWPIFKDSYHGYAGLADAQMNSGGSQPNSLLLCPPQANNAWIQGRIGVPRGTPVKPAPISIPRKCRFTARVGLTTDTPTGVSVKFTLGTVKNGETTFFPSVTLNNRSKTETYEADLSKLAGQEVEFVLRAEASAPLQQGCAAWIEPTIIQER